MGYLTFNEDLKTAAHNIISTQLYGSHALNAKNYIGVTGCLWGVNPIWTLTSITTSLIGKFLGNRNGRASKLTHDRRYFNSMYHITPALQKKLLSWVSKIKDARPFTVKQASMDIAEDDKKLFSFKRTQKRGVLNLGADDNGDVLASHKTRMATRNFGSGMFTTCTSVYYLPAGKGKYIIYFTFDGDSIEDAKVLCCRNTDPKAFKDGLDDSNFYVAEIPQWKSVKPEEYKK